MAAPRRPPFSGKRLVRRLTRRTALLVGIAVFLIITGFPVYWMVITALMTNKQLYDPNAFRLWDLPFVFQHVTYIFTQTGYLRWLGNTYLIGAVDAAFTLAIGIPAAYGFARLRLKGADTLAVLLFMTYLVSPALLFIPLSKVLAFLGVINTDWGLMIIYPTITVPFCTWLLTGFFAALPKDIEDAARVDGCSSWGAVWRVVLPLSRTGMLTVVIFAFTLTMQDFIYMLSYVSSDPVKPVNLGVVTSLIRGDIFYWGSLMAGALIAGLPIAILYNVFLDKFVTGLTQGATK
ncbi:MAG: carbohydrate ABC transporter permease [Streptosporangiaceae bacterium]